MERGEDLAKGLVNTVRIDFKDTTTDLPIAVVDGSQFQVGIKRESHVWTASVMVNGRRLAVSSAKRVRLFEKLKKSIKSVARFGYKIGSGIKESINVAPVYTPKCIFNPIQVTPVQDPCLREVVDDYEQNPSTNLHILPKTETTDVG